MELEFGGFTSPRMRALYKSSDPRFTVSRLCFSCPRSRRKSYPEELRRTSERATSHGRPGRSSPVVYVLARRNPLVRDSAASYRSPSSVDDPLSAPLVSPSAARRPRCFFFIPPSSSGSSFFVFFFFNTERCFPRKPDTTVQTALLLASSKKIDAGFELPALCETR